MALCPEPVICCLMSYKHVQIILGCRWSLTLFLTKQVCILHMALQFAFFFALRNTFTQDEFAYRNIHFFPWKYLCVKAIEMGPLVLYSACLLKSFVSL